MCSMSFFLLKSKIKNLLLTIFILYCKFFPLTNILTLKFNNTFCSIKILTSVELVEIPILFTIYSNFQKILQYHSF